MSRFPRFLSLILIGYAAIIAVGCSPAKRAGVLIYSDHTPTDDTCLANCLDTRQDRLEECAELHGERIGNCKTLHPVPPLENLSDLDACKDKADGYESNCRRAAATDLKNCVALNCGSEE